MNLKIIHIIIMCTIIMISIFELVFYFVIKNKDIAMLILLILLVTIVLEKIIANKIKKERI